MRIENHMAKLKEHIEALEWGIRQGNQSAIGFHTSAASVEMLSVLLHKKNKIAMDVIINHTWFRSDRLAGIKLNFDFPEKKKIISLMKDIEALRSPLCYGSPKPEEALEKIIESFRELKRTIEKISGEDFG